MDAIILQEQKLNTIIKKAVAEVMQDILFDEDCGLRLQKQFIKRLQQSVISKRAGHFTSLPKLLG